MFLSTHFSLAEFTASSAATRRGLNNNPPEGIIENLKVTAAGMERVLAVLGERIVITSGYRSPLVNQMVGAPATSPHVRGWAAEFICPQFGTPYEVCAALSEAKDDIAYDQLIHEYRSWVSISFEPSQREQDLTLFQPGRLLPGIQQ